MTDHVTYPPSVLLTLAEVHSVTRLSPAFVRIELASAAFVDLGEDGFDTRFKVVLPGPTGELPPIPDVPEDYYALWMDAPDDRRSPMRTYTVRDVVRDRDEVRLVVDFVVHEDEGHGVGPACRWALSAKPGDVIQVIAPHLLSEYGGTEFDPAGHRHVLLVGDETAVPAISRILADLGPGHHGEVFIEVPTSADILDLPLLDGFEVRWLPRNAAAYGRRVVQEVRHHLGLPPSTEFEALPELPPDPEATWTSTSGRPRATPPRARTSRPSCAPARSATTSTTPMRGSPGSPGWSRCSAAAWSPSSASSAPRSPSWATGARASR